MAYAGIIYFLYFQREDKPEPFQQGGLRPPWPPPPLKGRHTHNISCDKKIDNRGQKQIISHQLKIKHLRWRHLRKKTEHLQTTQTACMKKIVLRLAGNSWPHQTLTLQKVLFGMLCIRHALVCFSNWPERGKFVQATNSPEQSCWKPSFAGKDY